MTIAWVPVADLVEGVRQGRITDGPPRRRCSATGCSCARHAG